jgi:hypothetical protein
MDITASACSHRVLRRTSLTSMRTWRCGCRKGRRDGTGQESKWNKSKGLAKRLSLFLPYVNSMYPSASIIVARETGRGLQNETDCIRLHEPDYCNPVCAIPRGRATNRWTRKLTQNFFTLMDITWLLLNICVWRNKRHSPPPLPVPRTIAQWRWWRNPWLQIPFKCYPCWRGCGNST